MIVPEDAGGVCVKSLFFNQDHFRADGVSATGAHAASHRETLPLAACNGYHPPTPVNQSLVAEMPNV
ncbi:hypothetical protein [Chitinilyticum piscinae]|uniref:hypothetical protein n=1 Tax=Chitinilyticum piscinae TaxID=2866724 RepID=UPI0018818E43|nr:hypothetical protein [Chitinilyticum piscinae]